MENLKPLLIRADAGGATGTGHIMRMIALAQAYQRRGGKVAFICARLPEALETRLSEEDCEVFRISAEPGSPEDVRETLKAVKAKAKTVQNSSSKTPSPNSNFPSSNSQWLVIDGYHFDYEYQNRIKESGLDLLCVDDHGYSDRWCCDVILNQNLDAEKWVSYQNDLKEAEVLAGSAFCLLREEFIDAVSTRPEWGRIDSLLVTLGGSDPGNATEAVLGLLNSVCSRPLSIRVLAGADNPHLASLRSFKSHHAIEVVQNANDMPEQYAWADGIISAGGSTCWEWLHAGLPGAIVTIADNQLPIVEALSQTHRVALSLGWFNTLDEKSDLESFSLWLDAPETQTDRSAARSLIDGHGADRVCQVISGAGIGSVQTPTMP